MNVLPFFGGSYERFVNDSQSIALSYNQFETEGASFLFFADRDRRTVNTWLDYKFHQEDYYFGPYLKYKINEKVIVNSSTSSEDFDELVQGGLQMKTLSLGFLAGHQKPIGKNFIFETNIGIGYRQLLNERVIEGDESLEAIKDELNQKDVNLDLRLRIQFGYQF